jgi:predicted Zn-dependent protease
VSALLQLSTGYIEYDATSDTFVLTEADGTKRGMNYDFGSGYDSNDSS